MDECSVEMDHRFSEQDDSTADEHGRPKALLLKSTRLVAATTRFATFMDSTSRYGQPSRQPPPFRIRFYSDQFLRSLVDEDQPSSSNASNGRTAKIKPAQRGQQMASKNSTRRIATDKRTRREEQYQLQLAQQKIIQDRLNRSRILEASAKKERDFVHLVGEVAAGHSLVRELDKSLGVSDDAERSKKLKQFQEWNTNVHGVIQRRIDNALGSMDSTEINDRRRRDLETFLAITNSKTALFRDIIIESEYDPLEPNRRAIKARVSHLRDPCRRVLDKRTEENGLLSSDEKCYVDREPLVRKTFEVELWEDRRVKDTPHGVFARMMGRKVGQETKEVSRTYRTSFKLDDYSFEHGRDVVSTEFPKGKRTFQTTP